MKPDTHTVQELFETDVRYIVPLYQRPYVWDEEHQWQLLWDDIRAMLGHQALGTSEMWTHFLGAIVLDSVPMVPGQIPQFIVIDGQQRLTTLQLLLAAAARSLAAAGAEKDAQLIADLTENNPLKVKTAIDKLKVWPTNINRTAFIAAMSGDDAANDHTNLVQEAVAFFEARTAEYLTGDEDDEEEPLPEDGPGEVENGPDTPAASPGLAERAERLQITLCHLMKIVSITLESDDNAQVIFETLNARGTELNALDLTKNAVFADAQRQQLDTDSIYLEVWQPQLDDQYWRQERRQGRLFRPTGELFLMHWLTMKTRDLVPATELFPTFRRRVLANNTAAAALITELCSDAAVMRSFDAMEKGTPERQFFDRFQALDAGVILPVILLLFRSPTISVTRRRRALAILESWLTRRVLMRLQPKNYNRLAPRLVAKLSADLEHADDKLFEALIGGEGEISRWPDDKELREYLTIRPMYGNVSHPRLVMVLAAVEASLYSNKVESLDIPAPLSIEHLMPQEWDGHWAIVGDDGQPLSEEEREEVEWKRRERLHRLGNLTIVTGPMNSSLSNSAWPQKRQALNQHSKLLLNANLSEKPEWNLEQIDERTGWIADRIIEIWPGPDPASWA
jgi:Protein of unknown function DUF262/Protein of unknown function (DUF1524)